ncbi:MAG: caspase family protein, partial [Clostridiales bacterium]|nr:caspase family protein [Clostridiales bacterium]
MDKKRKTALVIGCSDYRYINPLAFAKNDAEEIHNIFAKELGFDRVCFSSDDARTDLLQKIEEFLDEADGYDIRAVYYSGHGAESDGSNYLLPVDFSGSGAVALYGKGITLSLLTDKLGSGEKKTNLFILDTRGNAPESVFQFSPEKVSNDTIIISALSKEELPIEERGNGHLTEILKKHIAVYGHSLQEVCELTREEFSQKYPSEHISVIDKTTGEIHLHGKESGSAEELHQRGERRYGTQDFSDAIKWYRRAAEQGYAPAQTMLGLCYYVGSGVAEDYGEAERWFKKAAEQDNADAQYHLGACREKAEDFEDAVRWYRKAAEQGQVDAQYYLGFCYDNGNAVSQDFEEAVRWYRKAAEQGHTNAQFFLGVCHYNGDGVPQNHAEAVRWYHKAAEQGHARAQYYLGGCYFNRDGVARNYTEAEKWYRKAAEQGISRAQYYLAGCYYNGDGVKQDFAEAAE